MQKRHSESTRGIKFSPHRIQCMERKFSCSLSKVCLWRTWKLSESTVLGFRIWDWTPNFYHLLFLTSKFYALFTVSRGGKKKEKKERKHKHKITFKSFSASCKLSSCVHPTLIGGKKLFWNKVNTIQYLKLDFKIYLQISQS